MNIIKVSSVVKKILIEFPEARDSDELLILKVWGEQEPYLRNIRYTFVKFAQEFKKGSFHSTESICRARRKIQEEFPQYRGESYKAKQNHQEDVKDQLKQPEMLAGGTP
jgi:hypothetical protein